MKQHLTGQENLVGLFLGVEDIEAKVGGKEAGTAKGEECEGFFQTGMGMQGAPPCPNVVQMQCSCSSEFTQGRKISRSTDQSH